MLFYALSLLIGLRVGILRALLGVHGRAHPNMGLLGMVHGEQRVTPPETGTPGMMSACVRTGLLAALLSLAGPAPARSADAVTEWTLEADRLGGGGANWHTLAIMHAAMHDAAQAVQPRYGTWAPRQPAPPGLSIEAALAGAAAAVLAALHPTAQAEIGALLRSALTHLPDGPAKTGGAALGQAVGREAVRLHREDGYDHVRPFLASTAPGRWRPAPPRYDGSNTTDATPFLLATRDWPGARPPPAFGSAAFRRDATEIHAIGGESSTLRTPAQTEAAEFWAYQSGQRGFVLLAVKLLDEDGVSDLAEHARLMSLLTAAMADAAILTWAEKERYAAWRPITVLQGGEVPGIGPDPSWQPLIETPAHPEYPSGHAADCFTGTAVLSRLFHVDGPIDYVAQSALPTDAPAADTAAVGMGQHAQAGGLHAMSRQFPSLAAAAQECADSRIWAGAHFRSANEESHRLADAIVAQAQASLPSLP